jgi:Na+/H+ antiporter NhaD/arsenite permease-like protein
MGGHASNVYFGMNAMAVSTVLLAITYAVIISEKVNRAIVALVGAGLMVVVGVLSQEEILVSVSRRSGMFQYVAVWSAQAAKAHPAGILFLLQITTAVLSAFLDNVTTVLLIVPVTLAIVKELDVPAYPYLFAEIFASNIGGTATLIGDPPNIMIHLIWGKDLKATPEREARVMAMRKEESITDRLLLKQSLVVLTAVMVAFVLARPLHLEPATIAMLGAAVLMLLDNWSHHAEKAADNVHKTFGDVEWITIFFFIGLFIVVHGVEVGGLLKLLADKLVAATGGNLAHAGYAILWASAVLSAIVDNIPFVATMIPLIKSMGPSFGGPDAIRPLWWCLSLGACLGGNGTLIGASANLTVAGLAERGGVPFRFITYTLYAFPMMLVSIAICHAYVWWRYF